MCKLIGYPKCYNEGEDNGKERFYKMFKRRKQMNPIRECSADKIEEWIAERS